MDYSVKKNIKSALILVGTAKTRKTDIENLKKKLWVQPYISELVSLKRQLAPYTEDECLIDSVTIGEPQILMEKIELLNQRGIETFTVIATMNEPNLEATVRKIIQVIKKFQPEIDFHYTWAFDSKKLAEFIVDQMYGYRT